MECTTISSVVDVLGLIGLGMIIGLVIAITSQPRELEED
jgi:hypothetical protein